jgi:hypothetical protein
MQESDFQGFQANQVLYNVEPEVSLDVFFSDDLRIVNSPIGHRATHSLAVARAAFLTEADAYELMHQVHQVGYIPCSAISYYDMCPFFCSLEPFLLRAKAPESKGPHCFTLTEVANNVHSPYLPTHFGVQAPCRPLHWAILILCRTCAVP